MTLRKSALALIIVGCLGYVGAYLTGYASPTALIPAALGVLALVFGGLKRKGGVASLVGTILLVLVALAGIGKPGMMVASAITGGFAGVNLVAFVAQALTVLFSVIILIRAFKK